MKTRTPAALAAVVVSITLCAGATPGALAAQGPDAVGNGGRATAPTPGSRASGDSLFPASGNGGYDVTHYDISLRYSRPNTIEATAVIDARATQNLSAFNLDLRRLHVGSITVGGQEATFSRAGHELTVQPVQSIANDSTFQTVIRYGGTPRTFIDPDDSQDGWIKTSDGATVVSEPVGAMTWFPDNNTPRDKATYDITITAPTALTAVSNGRLVDRVRHGATTRWHWRETDAMSTYLATVSIGNYDVVQGRTNGGTQVRSYLDPSVGGQHAAGLVSDVVNYWETLFGPYPFTSTGVIVDNVQVGYSLEVQTRPVFPFDPDTSTLVHELAHQWFGDSVTPVDWSDVWLNEGFATYAQWLWAARDNPNVPERHFQDLYDSHGADDPFWDVPVAVPGTGENLFGDAVYTRGAMALEAIRMRMGDQAFFKLLKKWPTVHREGNATTNDLRALAVAISGKRLKGLFLAWLYGDTKPEGY